MLKKISYSVLVILFLTVYSFSNELKITANNLEVDRDNKISIFSGDVYAYNEDVAVSSGTIQLL